MIVRPQGILGHREFLYFFRRRRGRPLDAPMPPAIEGE
jgi:hypothetical protein